MKSNDETITININKKILNDIKDANIQEKFEKMGRFNIHTVKVKLKTGKIEILTTNLDFNEFNYLQLKSLYKKKIEIETGFDRLKNYLRIENFSGRRIEIIEQDFYANIFLYNIAVYIKIDATKRIIRQPRKSNHKYEHVVNFSRIISLLYEKIYDLITDIKVMKELTIDFIIHEVARDPTNKRINVERKRKPLLNL